MAERSALIVDDGELEAARGVLAELDVRLDHVRGAPSAGDLEPPYDLIVSSVRHAPALASALAAREGDAPDAAVKTPWVVLHSQDFLPLRDRLRKLGVDFLVLTGVDEEALRLLFLHTLYAGPERRAQARLPVGAGVVYEVRHNDGNARLLDLTRDGCRVVGAAPVGAGMRIRLRFPAGVPNGREVEVSGRIVRVERSARGEPLAAIRFEEPDADALAAIDALLAGEVIGTRVTCLAGALPAVERSAAQAPVPEASVAADSAPAEPVALPEAEPAPPAPEPAAAPAAEAPEPRRHPPAEPSEAPTQMGTAPPPRVPAPAAQDPAEPDPAAVAAAADDELMLERIDRRQLTRARYERRVTAQTGGGTLVLLGRDLSTGGMRVAAAPGLGVGMLLRLSIFGGPNERPVVVPATVLQDDGERGLLLGFAPLKRPEQERIQAMIHGRPVVEALGVMGCEEAERVFVSRLDVESVPQLAAEPRCAPPPKPAAAAKPRPAAPTRAKPSPAAGSKPDDSSPSIFDAFDDFGESGEV